MRRITILTMLLTLFSVASFAQKALPFYMTNMTERTVPPFTQFTPLANIAEKTQRGSANQVVTPPTDLITEDYTFQATFFVPSGSSFSATAMKKLLKIGIQGNDVYVQGMSNALPEAWIKGTLNAARDKMSFESPQLYGYQNLFFPLYFVYMEFNSESDNLPDIMTFDYNAATGEITIPQQTIFIETTNSSDEGAQSNMNGFFYQIKWTKGFTHPVSAPENLETADYVITAKDNNNNDVSGAVKVGLDGNDVYIQGLSWLLPEGWVKGTMADNKITFAHDQYIGSYKNIQDLYLNYNYEDIIFDYDATSGTMTCQNSYFGVNNDTYTFNFFANAVIKKVTEKAATPAAPTITSIEATNSGDAMNFIVPVIDTEGNGLVASKLSYQLYYDIEKDIQPVVLKAWTDYTRIDQDMTTIPYGFTDNYDIYFSQIFLNMDHTKWNKVGIQSIYTGGGDERRSEISWYKIQDYTNGDFDFNKMNIATSTAESNAGDITTNAQLTSGKVTLTITASGKDTSNRYWATTNGPQLRVYGGQLIFECVPEKTIKKITFNAPTWGASNTFDTGDFADNVWTGESQKVTLNIGAKTFINSIFVEVDRYIPPTVEVPANLETEKYLMKFYYKESGQSIQDNIEVNVGHIGNDWYIQGLCDWIPEAWVKGTMENNVLTIPMWSMGTIQVMNATYHLVFSGATFNYDEQKSQLTSTSGYKNTNDAGTAMEDFFNITMTKIVEKVATPKTPACQFRRSDYGSYYCLYLSIPLEDTNGDPMLSDKLSYIIKGEKMGLTFDVTFTTDKYTKLTDDMTEIPYNFSDNYDISNYQIYMTNMEINEHHPEVIENMRKWSRIGVQSIYTGGGERKESAIGWFNLTNFWPSDGIEAISAEQPNGKTVIFDLSGRQVENPSKGIYIVNGKKVVIK